MIDFEKFGYSEKAADDETEQSGYGYGSRYSSAPTARAVWVQAPTPK